MADLLSIVSGFEVGVPVARLIKRGINAKAGPGTLVLATIPTGNKAFVPFFAGVEIAASSALTQVPIVSIGTNSPNFNNICAAKTLTGAAGGSCFVLSLADNFPLLSQGVQVTGNLSQVAASIGAVTLTLVVLGIWV